MKLLLLSVLLIGLSFSARPQTQVKENLLGLGIQAYPAGLITTVNYLRELNRPYYIQLRFGGNFTNRRDFSPYNDFEKGKGFGGSLGIRRNLPIRRGFLALGIHLDLWNMWIDWEDDIGKPTFSKGDSYTFVVQPWVELGYYYIPKGTALGIGLTTGFGREINVITMGEDVGQGWMNSISLNCHYVLR